MDPYEEREPDDVRILWGRVAALGGALVLAFLLGTWIGGGDDGIDEDEHLALIQERDAYSQRVEELEEQVDELSAGEAPQDRPTVEDEDEPDEDEVAEADDGDAEDGDAEQIYVVRSGDTLSGVAQRFYGTASQEARERIAEANDLEPDATLQVGQELVIPPAES